MPYLFISKCLKSKFLQVILNNRKNINNINQFFYFILFYPYGYYVYGFITIF